MPFLRGKQVFEVSSESTEGDKFVTLIFSWYILSTCVGILFIFYRLQVLQIRDLVSGTQLAVIK